MNSFFLKKILLLPFYILFTLIISFLYNNVLFLQNVVLTMMMIRISRRMGANHWQKEDKYITTPIELVDLAGGDHSVILSRRCLFLSIKPWSWHVIMETYSSTLGRELAITLQQKVLRKVSETWLIVISREKHWVF